MGPFQDSLHILVILNYDKMLLSLDNYNLRNE